MFEDRTHFDAAKTDGMPWLARALRGSDLIRLRAGAGSDRQENFRTQHRWAGWIFNIEVVGIATIVLSVVAVACLLISIW